jgi:hypothetical protein
MHTNIYNLLGICYIEISIMLLVSDMEVQIYEGGIAAFSS